MNPKCEKCNVEMYELIDLDNQAVVECFLCKRLRLVSKPYVKNQVNKVKQNEQHNSRRRGQQKTE